MTRDMELVREILFKIAEAEGGQLGDSAFESYSREFVRYHFHLIDDAGFVQKFPNGDTRVRASSSGCRVVDPQLSWPGSEFFEQIRDESVWMSVKEKLSGLKSASFSVISTIAVEVIKAKLGVS